MTNTVHSTIKKMSPQFLVKDLTRSINFYTNQLGFEVQFIFQDFYAEIMKDGCSIHLKSGQPNSQERENKRKNEDLDIVFSVEDVDDLYNEYANNAIEIVQ